MILIYGEILVDLIKQNDKNIFDYYLGGAPFNVAYAARMITDEVAFVGNVGEDALGKFIVEEVNQTKVISKIHYDKKHNTTMAFVVNDAEGERKFSFGRKNGADYYIPLKTVEIVETANLVHLGSLMLSEKKGYEFAEKLICKAKELNVPISFDINYREDIFKSSEQALKIYKSILKQVDIIKLSEDELTMFSGKTDIYEGLSAIIEPCQYVFVTLGSKGSIFYHNGIMINAPTIKVNPIDTTGAGDAFYGTVLGYIDRYGYKSFFENKELIKRTLELANIQGGLATTKKGALSAISSEKILLSYLNK